MKDKIYYIRHNVFPPIQVLVTSGPGILLSPALPAILFTKLGNV
jgi:hypothetical protein